MNWPDVISTIQSKGLSLTQIAAICAPCGQSTLSDLKNQPDREPNYRLGQALIHLSKASDREVRRLLNSIEAKAA